MMNRFAVGAAVVVMLLAGSTIAADALKSGPQEGSNNLPPFNPKHCNGPGAGGSACLV